MAIHVNSEGDSGARSFEIGSDYIRLTDRQ